MKGVNKIGSWVFLCRKSKFNTASFSIWTACISLLSIFVSRHALKSINNLDLSTIEIDESKSKSSDHTLDQIVMLQRERRFENDVPTFRVELSRSKTSSFYVCRFHNACITLNGTLLLHPNLQTFLINMSHCTNDIEFMKSPNEFISSSISSNFDLLGNKFPHYHIPHFVFDFLPSLIAYDVFTDKPDERVERNCIAPTSSDVCHGNLDLLPASILRLAHFVNEKDMKKKISSWVPQFLTMFSDDWYFYSRHDWFFKENITTRCFKSIIRFKHDNVDLHSLNWYRKTKIRHYIKERQAQTEYKRKTMTIFSKKICSFKILIIDRKSCSGRNIGNVEKLSDLISKTIYNKSRNIVPIISQVNMEDLNFHNQVQEVQSADFIIGSHGAGLSNLIFARPRTPVLEIYPFLYYPRYFRHLSNMFNLTYKGIIAKPDTQAFMTCTHKVSLQLGSPNMKKVVHWWNKSLHLWESFPQGFKDNWNDIEPTSLMTFQRRICLRAQTLHAPMDIFQKLLSEMLSFKDNCQS